MDDELGARESVANLSRCVLDGWIGFGYIVGMAQIQFVAVTPPMDSPGVGTLAARLLSYASAMDLLSDARTAQTLNYETLLRGIKKLAGATQIGSTTLVKLQERGAEDPSRLRALLTELYEELEQSPAPDVEWKPLEGSLGAGLLADLLDISPSSLGRYESGDRRTPDDVADRLHSLALVVSDLAGAYNEFGIRRWFERRRGPLSGRSPKEVLTKGWTSSSDRAQQVRRLASSLTASPTT
jgi:hypothetical protein